MKCSALLSILLILVRSVVCLNVLSRRSVFGTMLGAGVSLAQSTGAVAEESTAPKFQRVQTQFIAALGDPGASSGRGAETWGLWREDPGPRGVRLRALAAAAYVWYYLSSDILMCAPTPHPTPTLVKLL